MVHSLPQERWREKRPEPTESTFSISHWSRTNVLRPESVGNTSFNYPRCVPSANCNFLSQFGPRGCRLHDYISNLHHYLCRHSLSSSSSKSWDGGKGDTMASKWPFIGFGRTLPRESTLRPLHRLFVSSSPPRYSIKGCSRCLFAGHPQAANRERKYRLEEIEVEGFHPSDNEVRSSDCKTSAKSH